MPRTVEEILAHADALAARFEAHEPESEASSTPVLATLRNAVVRRADAERFVLASVIDARRSDMSWAAIGTMMGTTGEAARQRYGEAVATAQRREDVTERVNELLAAAGFAPDELREFSTLLEFAAVLAEAGHSGTAGGVHWSEEKARAMAEAISLITGANWTPAAQAPEGKRKKRRTPAPS